MVPGLFLVAMLLPAIAPAEARMTEAGRAPIWVADAVTTGVVDGGRALVLVGLEDDVDDTASLDDLARGAAMAQAEVLAALAPGDFELVKRYSHLPILAGRVNAAGLERLRRLPRVLSVDEDVWLRPMAPAASGLASPAAAGLAAPDASALALAESVPSIKADIVHQRYGIKGEGIGVAVLDTGIDNDHEDFASAIVDQYCFTSGSNSCVSASGRGVAKGDNAEDEAGHGTSVSGIVLGRGKVAPLGVAPEANLIAVRVFKDTAGAATNDIVDGLNWVVQKQRTHNIRVVNMSLGGGASRGVNCDNQYGSVKQVFQTLIARNVAVIVATGNGGNPDLVAFPACISNSMGIGSTWDTNLRLGSPDCAGKTEVGPFDIACYTDRGRAMALVAPGSIIVTPKMGGGATGSGPTQGGHGTSFAAPTVAGVAALVFQADPNLHARDLQRLLQQTGDIVIHPETGAEIKRVNALAAVESVLPPTPTPENTPTPAASETPVPATITPTPETPPTDEPTEPPTATRTPVAPPTATEGTMRAIYLPVLKNGQGL
jgi:subtilisin family serine protease